MALAFLALIPVVMGIFLASREVVRPPALFTISADILIPARNVESGDDPVGIPPVLLQGQTELALSSATKSAAIEIAEQDPTSADEFLFNAKLNDTRTAMTLSVAAPTAELAATVLDGYIEAYESGRRESVRNAALELQNIQARTVRVLERRIASVEQELFGRGLSLLPTVPDTDPLPVSDKASSDDILLSYERNALLNERQRRQIDYALQATDAEIPGKFSVVVQRRPTSRITPPPPSPLIPLLQILGFGLVLAVGVPVALDRFDGTITEARGAPGALRTGVLATLPAMPRRSQSAVARMGSEWDLAFRSLAATCISTDRLPKAIMVTSPAGTTQDFVAANFAAGLAGMGVTTALVGTVPRQAWFLGDDGEREEEGEVDTDRGSAAAEAPDAERASTFPELLDDAQAGRLTGDLRTRLGRGDRPNMFVIPPGAEGEEPSLDGLTPLLDALSRSAIDVVVIAGPALLPEPNATIIAWSTRHVLWAIELGQVEKTDAHLAADRLELASVEPFGIALLKRHALRT